MNHLQALKALDQQSKQANDDVKTIIDENMKQLRQDLQRQTKSALTVFQKNFTSTLRKTHAEYKHAIFKIQLLILIPLLLSCLLLVATGIWAGQQFNTLSQMAVLNVYPTAPYQGSQYVIVPQASTLADQKGNIWIKILK